jgi:hypothetical protein
MCLMLLLSPMSGKAHFVILLLPLMLAARAVADRQSGSLLVVAALLLSGPLVSKGVVGREWGGLLLDWGIATWHVLIALASIWWILGRRATQGVALVVTHKSRPHRARPLVKQIDWLRWSHDADATPTRSPRG